MGIFYAFLLRSLVLHNSLCVSVCVFHVSVCCIRIQSQFHFLMVCGNVVYNLMVFTTKCNKNAFYNITDRELEKKNEKRCKAGRRGGQGLTQRRKKNMNVKFYVCFVCIRFAPGGKMNPVRKCYFSVCLCAEGAFTFYCIKYSMEKKNEKLWKIFVTSVSV